jgi:hypothetical protein
MAFFKAYKTAIASALANSAVVWLHSDFIAFKSGHVQFLNGFFRVAGRIVFDEGECRMPFFFDYNIARYFSYFGE